MMYYSEKKKFLSLSLYSLAIVCQSGPLYVPEAAPCPCWLMTSRPAFCIGPPNYPSYGLHDLCFEFCLGLALGHH